VEFLLEAVDVSINIRIRMPNNAFTNPPCQLGVYADINEQLACSRKGASDESQLRSSRKGRESFRVLQNPDINQLSKRVRVDFI
jgi:hypothetical protein